MRGWAMMGTGLLMALACMPVSAQSESGTVEVPLKMEGGRLSVPVQTADGESLDFILSNGQGVTLISESLAGRVGEEPALTLGGVPVSTDRVVTITDAQLTLEGHAFDGIIGANTLNQYDVLVDAPGGRLLLKPFSTSVEWPGVKLSPPVSIQVFHGVAISLAVTVDGGEYRGSLDLGRPTSVVNEGLRATAGLEEEDTASIGLGGVTHGDQPVQSLDLDIFERWDPDGNGFILLGAPFARNCAISISYVHQEIRTCVP